MLELITPLYLMLAVSMMTLLVTVMVILVLAIMMPTQVLAANMILQILLLLVHAVFVEVVAQVNNLTCQQKADF